jgi:hypothetical protein
MTTFYKRYEQSNVYLDYHRLLITDCIEVKNK